MTAGAHVENFGVTLTAKAGIKSYETQPAEVFAGIGGGGYDTLGTLSSNRVQPSTLPVSKTVLKPLDMAIGIATADPRTDEKPLAPIAHAMALLRCPQNSRRPLGNGTPIGIPSRPTPTITIAPRAASGSDIDRENTGPRSGTQSATLPATTPEQKRMRGTEGILTCAKRRPPKPEPVRSAHNVKATEYAG